VWVIVIGLWTVFVIASYFIARGKGRDTRPFVIVTMLCGIVGVLWAIFAEKQDVVDARPRLSRHL
jgi:hypothetical protein